MLGGSIRQDEVEFLPTILPGSIVMSMFDHEWIEEYGFEDIPLNRDVYLMEERWLHSYEKAMVAFLRGKLDDFNVGEVAFAAARGLAGEAMQMSWYPNIADRFHEVRVHLPRSAFVAAVGCSRIDEKPRVFVRNEWMRDLYESSYSIFAMVDAIGVKDVMFRGQLSSEKLRTLQSGIDGIADTNPDIAFISFADSLLLKLNWHADSSANCASRYDPERLLNVIEDVQRLFCEVLGLDIYVVLAQGSNEYGALLHRSNGGNHVSLNSLGLPFAQILAIDNAARSAIRSGSHDPAEVYMDESFFNSLRMRFGFPKASYPRSVYSTSLSSGTARYVRTSRKTLIDNLFRG